jgi:large subunit ribosomal protein L33
LLSARPEATLFAPKTSAKPAPQLTLACRRPIRLQFGACENEFEAAKRQEALDMAKGKKKVETVFLVCEETGDHNYVLRRKSGGEKLKLKKYSPRLRRHTLHAEKKK